MLFILVIAVVTSVLLCIFLFRPKHSLKARAQERYRRDRRATRQREIAQERHRREQMAMQEREVDAALARKR